MESPVEQLERWEAGGARWRVRHLGDDVAVVELLACTGEQVDELRSSSPELLAWLHDRGPSSED
jgi:hypothetical protein